LIKIPELITWKLRSGWTDISWQKKDAIELSLNASKINK
jgi:hypothetical protein